MPLFFKRNCHYSLPASKSYNKKEWLPRGLSLSTPFSLMHCLLIRFSSKFTAFVKCLHIRGSSFPRWVRKTRCWLVILSILFSFVLHHTVSFVQIVKCDFQSCLFQVVHASLRAFRKLNYSKIVFCNLYGCLFHWILRILYFFCFRLGIIFENKFKGRNFEIIYTLE